MPDDGYRFTEKELDKLSRRYRSERFSWKGKQGRYEVQIDMSGENIESYLKPELNSILSKANQRNLPFGPVEIYVNSTHLSRPRQLHLVSEAYNPKLI